MLTMNITGLFVNDMGTMVAFYRDVMGMKTDWSGAANADLYSGDVHLIMFSRANFEKMTARSYAYPSGVNGTIELAFNAPSFSEVDKEYDRVVKLGAKPVYPPTNEPWGQRTCYVADPDGNLIEISSFTKDEA